MPCDPRLRIPEDSIYEIEMFASPGAFVTDLYDYPLAGDFRGDTVWVRAATGEEVTDLLTTGEIDEDDERDGIVWPGDPATALDCEIAWQEIAASEPQLDPACRLWAGEVLFRSGRGRSGPFYVHQQAARAWAFSTALSLPEAEVFAAQVLPYICARRCAPALLLSGEAEFSRLNRMWESPLRSLDEPQEVPLPGRTVPEDL